LVKQLDIDNGKRTDRATARTFTIACTVFTTRRKWRSRFGATYHRTTKKGDRMAWLTLADATGAIEAAVFPQAFERLTDSGDGESPLREGAFLVARGRLSQEEATGSKLFVDEVHVVGSKTSHMRALLVAIEEQQPDEWSCAPDA
jgi:DNA polymerase III alpha subunit